VAECGVSTVPCVLKIPSLLVPGAARRRFATRLPRSLADSRVDALGLRLHASSGPRTLGEDAQAQVWGRRPQGLPLHTENRWE
jgi:hypothetical protein